MPDDLTDEQFNDAIAAEAVAAIPANYSPEFRARLVSLYVRQLLGVVPQKPSQRALAEALGEAPQRVSEIERRALAKAWLAYQTRYPHLCHHE